MNVTCEIENFFPGLFDYYNIRVHDEEGTDMLRYLNDTYCYIRKAKYVQSIDLLDMISEFFFAETKVSRFLFIAKKVFLVQPASSLLI